MLRLRGLLRPIHGTLQSISIYKTRKFLIVHSAIDYIGELGLKLFGIQQAFYDLFIVRYFKMIMQQVKNKSFLLGARPR